MSSEPVTRTSTRNKLASTITAIKRGDVVSQVEMQSGDNHLVAVITTEAVDEMGLHEGMEVVAMFKSTSVMVATRSADHNAG